MRRAAIASAPSGLSARIRRGLAGVGVCAVVTLAGVAGFSGPASAEDFVSDDSAGVANGNQAEAPVQAPANLACNALGVLGNAVADCGGQGGEQPADQPGSSAGNSPGGGQPDEETPPPGDQPPGDNQSEQPPASGNGGNQQEVSSQSTLPRTGSSVTILVVAAGALIGGGIVLRRMARRRTGSAA